MTATTAGSPRTAAETPGPGGPLTGAGTLIRLILRRDRVRIPVWMLGVTGFVVASAASLADVFGSEAARSSRAELMANPTLKAFRGPGYGLEDYTVGAMVANELLLLSGVAVALMSILLVVRHTRGEEESGRTELVRASVVGPHAGLVAALVVVVGVNVAIGALIAAGLAGAVSELALTGSLAHGASTAAMGVVFGGAAAVAAQVTEYSRGAVAAASVALGTAFVVRAVGDTGGVGDRAPSWASPIGWAQSTRPFVDERWWPLLLCAGLALVLAVLAVALSNRRDVAAGLVRPRPGSPTASDGLVRPAGLPLRLQRAGLVGWATGVFLLGAVFGAVTGEIDAFLAENPQMEEILGAAEGSALIDSFLATVVLILALLATGYAVGAALQLRTEETRGRAEPLLAAGLSRVRWAAGHVAVVLGGSAAVLLAGTAGLGGGAVLDQGDAAIGVDILVAGLVAVPAVWLAVGVAVAVFGLAPRAAALAWLVLAHATVVGLLGDVLDLPAAVRALSPFHHVPGLPAAQVTWAPVLAVSAVAAGLIALGLAAFRRRDLHAT